ncbi:MAG: tripartite tricarboxylate transporter substrate binding protein [Proteobacteria bacterium]|jgi:tripartite-type tricarboxylate transporter receptor subunit TctC|nr:tripartite tricarboxylate transporter substrate binding protein [Pseudomonadota bacterium]
MFARKWNLSVGRSAAQVIVALAGLATAPTVVGQSANWPNGPIVFVAPFSPGGGGDTLTRLYANEIGKFMGTPFVVENKPGAGGNIGTAAVARAVPDGNTVIFGTMGTMGTNHALYKSTGYAVADFEPVALFGSVALALVVNPNSPFQTVDDIVDHAKAHPDELSCASGGNGTVSHLACALLQQMAGVRISHVPYGKTAAAYVDIMSDRVTFIIDVLTPLTPQIKGGKLRAVAVSMKQRVPALPNTPPISDTVPGYEIFSWDGLFAPKGVPAERLDKLHNAVTAALSAPDFRQTMSARGIALKTMTRKEFAAFVQKEYVRMNEVVRKMGVTLD